MAAVAQRGGCGRWVWIAAAPVGPSVYACGGSDAAEMEDQHGSDDAAAREADRATSAPDRVSEDSGPGIDGSNGAAPSPDAGAEDATFEVSTDVAVDAPADGAVDAPADVTVDVPPDANPSCRPGQEPCGDGGSAKRDCLLDGGWGPLGICVYHDCVPSAVDAESCGTEMQQTRTCNMNGTWSAFGACVPVPCQPLTIESVACGDGGTHVRVCNSDGTWSDWSTCTP